MSAPLQVRSTLESAAEQAMRRAGAYLAAQQARDGHWCAELTADSTLESDFILFQLWLHPPEKGVGGQARQSASGSGVGEWRPETRPLIDKAVRSILDRQLPDGGFNICVAGPSEVSASVKAYFALKLAGVPIEHEPM